MSLTLLSNCVRRAMSDALSTATRLACELAGYRRRLSSLGSTVSLGHTIVAPFSRSFYVRRTPERLSMGTLPQILEPLRCQILAMPHPMTPKHFSD